jgi:hypothetical protein
MKINAGRHLAKLSALFDQCVPEWIIRSSRPHELAAEPRPWQGFIGKHFANDLELIGLVERTESEDLAVRYNLDLPPDGGAALRTKLVVDQPAAFATTNISFRLAGEGR